MLFALPYFTNRKPTLMTYRGSMILVERSRRFGHYFFINFTLADFAANSIPMFLWIILSAALGHGGRA